MTEKSYHDVRDMAFHWMPTAREDLRWYEWAYWIARVLLKECYQNRCARLGGIAFAALALVVCWNPATALAVAGAGLRLLLVGLSAVVPYASFAAFRSALWLPDKGACFRARLAAFTSGTCSGTLAIACASNGLMAG